MLPMTICPLDLTVKLSSDVGEPILDPVKYRKLAGKLNYLTHTQLDITFAVQLLSQFMRDPCIPHLEAVHHTIRYIKSNPSLGFHFTKDSHFELKAYCDSDWVSCPSTKRSISGYLHSPWFFSYFMEIQETGYNLSFLYGGGVSLHEGNGHWVSLAYATFSWTGSPICPSCPWALW